VAHPDPGDIDAFLVAAQAAADAAGAVVRPAFRSGLAADLKGDQSPVTAADRGAEQAMRAVLAQHFPGHGILGEEYGLERPESRWRWVLDPIDGTRAFITGRPVFGTLVALLDGARPVVGVIDQPVTGERWLGAAGRPTRFSGRFGGRAGCRRCPALAQAELSCTSPQMFGGGPHLVWRRLLRLWPARARPDRRDRRGGPENLGLGRVAAGDRRRGRVADRLAGQPDAAGRRRAGAGARRPRFAGGCGAAARRMT
jgi:fructose-1,6-bisphosphatase/inositol monophosphatase family enzyme